MKKITKKSFIDALISNTSVLVGSVFNRSEDAIENAINNIEKLNTSVTRTGALKGKYICFKVSNGTTSSLALNDSGSHDYYIHEAKSGMYYIQKTTQTNDYGCEVKEDVCYCIYALV